MTMHADIVDTLGFTDEEISECFRKKGLLSIELEFTRKCNLRCLYCYSSAAEPAKDELGIDELKSVIYQAKELGAKKIVLLGGGEPLLYDGLEDIINYIRSIGLQQVLFTNGILIKRETTEFLLRNKVAVIVKRNSFKPEVQDTLAGVRDSFKKIKKGLELLIEAGYLDNGLVLGIQTVICRQNIDELPSMWIWAREKGIIPYFEILTHQGRAKENADLNVSVSEVKAIFKHLEKIDQERFGIIWSSHPTVAAFSCKRHLYSCLINSQGYVQPCTGVDMPVGSIREKPLNEILENSSVINNLRHIHEKIQGYCGECEHGHECYGCRGNAYQITDNYLASDPTCWRCEKAGNEDSTRLCKQ